MDSIGEAFCCVGDSEPGDREMGGGREGEIDSEEEDIIGGEVGVPEVAVSDAR